MITLKIPVWVLIATVTVLLAILAMMFLSHLYVGAQRHSLNHIEHSKDVFYSRVKEACGAELYAKYFLPVDDDVIYSNDYISSRGVYRSVRFRSDVLRSELCFRSIITQSLNLDYPMKIYFVGEDKSVVALFLKLGEK